jgi:lysophospholipase L1-like esterase
MNNLNLFRFIPCLFAITTAGGQAGEGIKIQNGQKIAFMGDSITAFGWGSPGGYVKLTVDALAKAGIKVEPIPAGQGGNTSKDMLARLDTDVLSKQADWMTLSCGVNDVWHGANGVALDAYKLNITAIVDKATAKGVKVVILTATPIGESNNLNNQKAVGYNDFLREFAKERNLPLVDLSADFHEVLKNLPTDANSRFLTADGVHMNAEGNVLMAKGCLRALGLSKEQISKTEQAWLLQPDTAAVSIYPFDPRPDFGITLGQLRGLSTIAKSRNTNFANLNRTLWLQAMGEAIQTHEQDAVIDAEALKKETNARFLKKMETLLKNQP